MKAVIFSDFFKPNDEFKEFCERLGYTDENYSKNFNLMFDERVVEFCEARLTDLWDEKVYRGRPDFDFRCGFAGSGYIREIDVDKKWIIRHNNVDAPIITYVEPEVNRYGFFSLKYEGGA